MNDEYLFGPSLLVAPVTDYKARERSIYLPATTGGWYNFWTGARSEGGRADKMPAPYDQIPLFVRDGSAVAKAIGDLNKEWLDSTTIAKNPPDLERMEREVKTWFAQNGGTAAK